MTEQKNINPPKHITDWIRMKTSLDEIVNFTTEVIQDIESRKIPKEEYKKVLYQFFQRFHLNFIVIKNSWKEFLNNSKFKYPFYVLLRSLISDYIIMLYLLIGLKINRKKRLVIEEGFIERYAEVSHSFFKKFETEFRKLIKQGISSKTFVRFMLDERKKYPNQFEHGNGINLKKYPDLMPGIMARKIKQTRGWKKFAGIYLPYIYLSQYEHFTKKTVELMAKDGKEEFKMMTLSIDYLLLGLYMNLAYMQVDQKHLIKLDSIRNDFKNKFNLKWHGSK